jgi:hypothetical protein
MEASFKVNFISTIEYHSSSSSCFLFFIYFYNISFLLLALDNPL